MAQRYAIESAMRDPGAQPLFLSSGDLIADRRYAIAQEFCARGDIGAAIDLLQQAIERAQHFASAWFLLGELRERSGDAAGAVAAFRAAGAADPQDRLGARLALVRLGAADASQAMSPAYVRALFDQYAPRFDGALVEGLAYRAPALLRGAVETACAREGRPARFAAVLDLGCGTGLAGAAFRPLADRMVGVDLSPGMLAQAAAKHIYDRLETADILVFLEAERDAGARHDLIVAADVLAYFAELGPLLRAAARVLAPEGVLAFTVETHAGEGVVLGEKLRYAHAAAHVRAALGAAGLRLLDLTEASTRTEAGAPVPGLLVVAQGK
jgi:predicted TPR repeat methyltransferase